MEIQKTALYEYHKSLGAKFVPFAGYEMPVQYSSGIVDEHIFTRTDGMPWGRSHQRRRLNDAAKKVGIKDVSFHILRHTYGSALAMQGVPMAVIATALGHSDTRMTEKHYAALAPNYVAETIRGHLPKLGIENELNNIVKIKHNLK